MDPSVHQNENQLVEHFFRSEYGKMVSVVAKYLGQAPVETAEDIVQETLLTAVEYWQHHGIPENPTAWLYTTARNKTFNFLKRQKYKAKYEQEEVAEQVSQGTFSEEEIADEQLRMMFACCHDTISEEVQITLILKILCGFSLAEIADAFFTSADTINKRLVRGRKKLRDIDLSLERGTDINANGQVVLKTIYLLFNEGYLPKRKNQLIRSDLCLESIRLAHLLLAHPKMTSKAECHSILALMYLNVSRFEGRANSGNLLITMDKVDRSLWNKELIDKGLFHLDKAQAENKLSNYLLMASISAHYSIAPSFEETHWAGILALYDAWLKLEDMPLIRLNRAIVLSMSHGNAKAIEELKQLESKEDLMNNHLFYSTMGEMYHKSNHQKEARFYFLKAIEVCDNERDQYFLNKKLLEVVPVSQSQL